MKKDSIRQNGFYSDPSGKLISATISKQQYEEAFLQLERVRKMGKELIEGFLMHLQV